MGNKQKNYYLDKKIFFFFQNEETKKTLIYTFF